MEGRVYRQMRKRIEEYIKDLGVKSVIISTFVFLATIQSMDGMKVLILLTTALWMDMDILGKHITFILITG